VSHDEAAIGSIRAQSRRPLPLKSAAAAVAGNADGPVRGAAVQYARAVHQEPAGFELQIGEAIVIEVLRHQPKGAGGQRIERDGLIVPPNRSR
jgi:hypothetical protein